MTILTVGDSGILSESPTVRIIFLRMRLMKKVLSSIFVLIMILNCVSVSVQANDIETTSEICYITEIGFMVLPVEE